jgi:hypothetical protein
MRYGVIEKLSLSESYTRIEERSSKKRGFEPRPETESATFGSWLTLGEEECSVWVECLGEDLSSFGKIGDRGFVRNAEFLDDRF